MGSSAFTTESGRLRHHGEQKENQQAVVQTKEVLRPEAGSEKNGTEEGCSKKENGDEEVRR
jgi:hypothetical protein